jgi:hypothetical protein
MRRCLCVQTRVLWALQIALGWWMTDLKRDHGSASHCGSKVPGWRSRRIVSGWGWAVAGRRLDTQFTLRSVHSVVIDATVSYKKRTWNNNFLIQIDCINFSTLCFEVSRVPPLWYTAWSNSTKVKQFVLVQTFHIWMTTILWLFSLDLWMNGYLRYWPGYIYGLIPLHFLFHCFLVSENNYKK